MNKFLPIFIVVSCLVNAVLAFMGFVGRIDGLGWLLAGAFVILNEYQSKVLKEVTEGFKKTTDDFEKFIKNLIKENRE